MRSLNSTQCSCFVGYVFFIGILNGCAQSPSTDAPAIIEATISPALNNSLLANGAFLTGAAQWTRCSSSEIDPAIIDGSEGNKILSLGDTACVYQEFKVTPGNTYSMVCNAKAQAGMYASITLSIMNSEYEKLAEGVVEVNGGGFSSHTANVSAPATGRIGAVTFYSEGTTEIDNCSVTIL